MGIGWLALPVGKMRACLPWRECPYFVGVFFPGAERFCRVFLGNKAIPPQRLTRESHEPALGSPPSLGMQVAL